MIAYDISNDITYKVFPCDLMLLSVKKGTYLLEHLIILTEKTKYFITFIHDANIIKTRDTSQHLLPTGKCSIFMKKFMVQI